MNFQKFVIYLAAGFFLLYGLAFSIAPTAMALLITGAELQGTSAIVDFRATYGGMTIAVGLIMLYLSKIGHTQASLIAIILVLMGMALTRTLGFIVDGRTNLLMYVYLGLELVGSVLAWLALRKTA